MGVIRLIVLAVLLYFGWVLFRSLTAGSRSSEREGKAGNGCENSSAQDVLVEDPVCHTLVPKHQAIRLRSEGTTYYFCSEECCDTFSEQARGDQ